ncbi:unnamed protein product [Allacma fusca]|uniref:Nuclease HARBI1 n=1 Tax=Allacma fusca TaxID=39272 RepID=A0A8J2JBE9_9HEXA|nr:unnamed protein product [Allacma fusca]
MVPAILAKKTKVFKVLFLAITLLFVFGKYIKRRPKKQRFWVRPFLKLRKDRGDFYVAVPDMIREDPEYYFQQFRMTPEKFNELLNLVAPKIAKLDTVREAISPAEPLYMTLAFLVSGDQQKSVSKDCRLGRSTVCGIIRETTKVIFEVLRPIYLKPHSPDDFRKIAHDFKNM